MVAKFKKTIATIVTAAWLFAPALVRSSNNQVDGEYLDQNKKVIERVDYTTFRNNLDNGVVKQKIENQELFIERILQEINNQSILTEERGYNLRRGVNEQEFSDFIFENVLKRKLNYKIKTPTDLIVGLNMALEYLTTYNYKMLLEAGGLGSDLNDDGRFDGISWSSLQNVDKKLQQEVIKHPRKGDKIAREEGWKADFTPTDMLLMGLEEINMDTNTSNYDGYTPLKYTKVSKNQGKPNAVEIVCRNYTSALEVMFETAKKKYPELTKDLELLQMPMPGHIFGAFVNKKTLEYIVVDPTWHDYANAFDIKTLVWPPDERGHYDCLKDEALFQTLKFEKDINAYWVKLASESFLSHKGSKKMLKELVPRIKELVKKYPNSQELLGMEVRTYMSFTNHKEFSKSYALLKEVYDNKEKRAKLDSFTHCMTLLCLGELAFELKDYKQSVNYFQECSRLWLVENNFADEAMAGLAEANLEMGNYHEALFRAKDVLDFLPDYYKGIRKIAEKVVSKASKKIWDGKKRIELSDYLKGDYKKAVESLTGQDAETKLLLAESYASLNNYEKAKTIYKELEKNDDKNIASLAQSELEQMNRKFYAYGYMHFFDNKFEKVIDEFEFLKSQITPQDKVAEKVSFFLILSYANEKQAINMLKESDYFLKNFPNSEFKKVVEDYMRAVTQSR
jgi:tetratricopeptide (TPR) repeat protein